MLEISDVSNLQQIVEIGSRLNDINDIDILLERILQTARNLTNADAGSIYIAENGALAIHYAQNETQQVGLPPGEKLIYSYFTIPISTATVSGYCAVTRQPVNINDVYKIPENAPYSFNTAYDQRSGYRTRSVICVPLRTNMGQIVGVIQLINKLKMNEIISFTKSDELLLSHFAANATVALQRAQMTRTILLRMIKMAELRDPKETGQHVNRVAGYATEIYEYWAKKHEINVETIAKTQDNLRMAAMLHDVGKVAISDVILKKPGRFTPEEYDIIKSHTLAGARLFFDRQSEFDELASVVALNHHESWDGTGYPGYIDANTNIPLRVGSNSKPVGKKGHEIPLFGRIVSIADVYDALRSQRSYKKAWTEEQTLEEMHKMSGTKFDPELLDVFFHILPNINNITRKYSEDLNKKE